MKKHKGFTLVELLAVIVILAIIMLIAIPAVLSTLATARRKGFIEYVDKIYLTTQKQVLEEETLGKPITGCKTFYIKKDLGLNNTGSYDGFVLVKNDGFSDIQYYITLHDDEYKIDSYLYDGSLDIDNLESFIDGEEIDSSTVCSKVGCSTCSVEDTLTGEQVCSYLTQVTDSTPGTFDGSGNENDPFKIESIEDLVALSVGTNDGSLGSNKYYKLMLDLSFDCDKSYVDPNGTNFGDINEDGTVSGLKTELTTGSGFVPIGKDYSTAFSSLFDGNNKKIYGLYINRPSTDNVGLFGHGKTEIDSYNVKSLSVLDADVTGGSKTGIVIGYVHFGSNGFISDLISSGTVNGSYYVGGIVGEIVANNSYSPYVENLVNRASIIGNRNVGGVSGEIDYTKCNNLTNYGNVASNGGYSGGVSGAVAYAQTSVSNFKNYGKLTVNNDHVISGGVFGFVCDVEISDVYNYGEVIGTGNGFIAGAIGELMKNSYSNTAGYNIYNYGKVKSVTEYVAGAIGYLVYVNAYNVYNYGSIEAPESDRYRSYVGGLVSQVNYSSGLYNGGNHGNITCNGNGYIGGVSSYGYGIVKNVYNYGNINVTNNTTNSVIVGCLSGEGNAYNSYSNCDITVSSHPSDSNYDFVGLGIGHVYQSSNTGNIYSLGSIKANNKNKYYVGALFGDYYYGYYDTGTYSNFYAKGNILGYDSINIFAGRNQNNGTIQNSYTNIYTDATDIDDKREDSFSNNFSKYYYCLNDSPNKKTLSIAQEYDFSQVNGMWFRDTLKLGNNWQYSNGYYPKLYKVLPNGSVSSELVEGQKDIPIK